MKTMISQAPLSSFLVGLACLVPLVSAISAESDPATAVPSAVPAQMQPDQNAAVAAAAEPKLPYGVEDVVKLSRAQISDDVVLNYIRNSGTIYTLGPQEIVYLRNQGVSERVINAMIDQRKVVAQGPQQAQQAPAIPNAPFVPDAATIAAAPNTQVAPMYAEAPSTPPASTVYVIPDRSYNPYYYPYYGYYSPYYYGGPVISLGFGYYGHYYHGGHYYGGYHGGYHGGGYHGGSGHGGHGGHH